MKILTQEIINRMPGPRAQENVDDPTVHLKLFNPYGSGTWLVTEAWQVVETAKGEYEERPLKAKIEDGEKVVQRIIFGWAEIGYGFEVGTSDLDELLSLRKFGRPMIEREKWESDGKHRLSKLKTA